MSTDSETKSSQPHPFARLCHVIKSDNFDGYGFNLHAEKGKPGQYIGKVDEGSPAELAGLRQGDRILEVNGVSIINETHKQVVQRIKALPNETKLFVVDPDDEQPQHLNNHEDDDAVAENNGSTNNLTATTDNNSNASSTKSVSETTTASANNGQALDANIMAHVHAHAVAHAHAHAHVHAEETTEDTTNANGNSKQDILNLSMTAAELRAKLAAKKKFDPRKEQIDFKKKFDTVQKL